MFSFLSGASPTVFPEIDTVKDPQDCIKIAEKAFQALQAEINAPDWNPLAYEDAGFEGLNDIKISDRVVPGSTVSYGRAVATIPIAPKALFDKLWEFKEEWARTFDVDMREFAKLLDVNEDIMVSRVRANAPFPVAPREFVVVRARKEQDGVYYIFSTSVNYEHSEVDATYVRGVIAANGFILKAVEGDPNKTSLTRISGIDPKGNIPLWVINLVKTKGGDYMVRLRVAANK